MAEVSTEVVGIIYHLLPGFVTAWIFYGLTAHRRQSPFERTVQALIFTAIVRALVLLLRTLSLSLGSRSTFTLGSWTQNTEYIWSIVLAVLLGHVLALAVNKNIYHRFLVWAGITLRTAYPSEWHSTFARCKQYITLHLDGERRLMGWPYEWPDHPDAGHFVIQEPVWILDDNTEVPVLTDDFILVPVTSVEMVEFVKFRGQIEEEGVEIEEGTKTLVNLQKRDKESE